MSLLVLKPLNVFPSHSEQEPKSSVVVYKALGPTGLTAPRPAHLVLELFLAFSGRATPPS